MAGLQRSAVSFRRQGSSGLIWDDKILSDQLNQVTQKEDADGGKDRQEHVKGEVRTVGSIDTIERSRSNGGGRAFRTGKVSPAIEPPSPKVSACGFCAVFEKPNNTRRRPMSGKRRT